MSVEKLTISKTGYKKGYISYSDGCGSITFKADYNLGKYALCRSEMTPQGVVTASYEAVNERIEAESRYSRLLKSRGLVFCPLMFRRQIESMGFEETICRVVSREIQEFENEH